MQVSNEYYFNKTVISNTSPSVPFTYYMKFWLVSLYNAQGQTSTRLQSVQEWETLFFNQPVPKRCILGNANVICVIFNYLNCHTLCVHNWATQKQNEFAITSEF